jgi:hypothetical protein
VEQEDSVSQTVNGKDWERLLFVVLLSAALYLEVVYATFLLVLLSVVRYLIKGSVDPRIANFSDALITVISDTLRYVLFRSEKKPWPISPWPAKDVPSQNDAAESAEVGAAKVSEGENNTGKD